MPHLFPAVRPFVLAAMLLSGPAFAQTPPAASSAPTAVAPAVSPASAFDGYRRFEAQPIAPWRDSNDTVGRIGGWKAYAREAQQPASAPEPAAGRTEPTHGHAH